jgi:hypothetical protein
MIAQTASPQAYDKFVEYMHHVKKPPSMDPSALVDRAQTLFRYATYFLPIDENTAGPEIPVAQQKRMILNMFPEPWVRNFTNSGQNPSTVTIATLLSYMNEQHSAEVTDSERKHSFNYQGGQNDNTKRTRDNGNGHQSHYEGPDGHSDNTNGNYSQCGANNSHEHDYRAHNGHPNGKDHAHNGHANGNHRGSFPPIQQDNECRIHGGHLWRKCYLNPRQDNTDDKHDSIILLSMAVTFLPVQNCNGLHIMAEHPVRMLVGMVLMVHHPTQLANLLSIGDSTWTLMSILSLTMFNISIFSIFLPMHLLSAMKLLTFHTQFICFLHQQSFHFSITKKFLQSFFYFKSQFFFRYQYCSQIVSLVHTVPSAPSPIGVAVCSD